MKSQSGQILLIMLLVMVVGLTVGLAVVARSVTSVKISTEEEQSQQSFYAAEAGLEEALLSGSLDPLTKNLGGGVAYAVRVSPASEGGLTLDNAQKDETQNLWLVNHNLDGTLCDPGGCTSPPGNDGRFDITKPIYICWDEPSSGDTTTVPAMEIIIIHQRTIGNNAFAVARGAYDPDGRSNNFSAPSKPLACGSDFSYGQTISFSSFFSVDNQRVVAIRLRPIYNGAKIGFRSDSGIQFPPQGVVIESLGTSGSTQRKLRVNRGYPLPPSIFDFALFSGRNLEK